MALTEIRIFSRGGQGGVTGAKLLAYAASLEGYEVQAIPKYGAERKGAPIFVDVRISDRPIRIHSPVGNFADHYIVLEPSLLSQLTSIRNNSLVVVNAREIPDDFLQSGTRKVGKVDAYQIADETNLIKSGTRIVSTTMLGAWIKATNDMVQLSSIEKAIRKTFSGETAEHNIDAIKKAYERFEFVGSPVLTH